MDFEKEEEVIKKFIDQICKQINMKSPLEEALKRREDPWKPIAFHTIKNDKNYLVRNTNRLDIPPIVAYWDEEMRSFIDIRSYHAYGVNVDECMEIPE